MIKKIFIILVGLFLLSFLGVSRVYAVGTECGGGNGTCPSGYYCSGGNCYINPTAVPCTGLTGTCSNNDGCCSGYCVDGHCASDSQPTYTCSGACYGNGQMCTCGSGSGTCQGDDTCCNICPTSTPTPACRSLSQSCGTSSPCCTSNVCWGGVCKGPCDKSLPLTYCENVCTGVSGMAKIYCAVNENCYGNQANWVVMFGGVAQDVGTKYCPGTGPTPTSYCHPVSCYNAPDATYCSGFNPGANCGYAGNCDNCGGIDCGWCGGVPPGGPTPTPGCDPKCTNTSVNPCIPQTCYNKSCQSVCTRQFCVGTKLNDCACAANTCVGQTCAGTCGDNCPGTLTQTAGTWGACKADCSRNCIPGRCGGACTGTAPSCAVNGTFSSWSPNNCSPQCGQTVTRTCSAVCGGSCSDGEGSITSKKCTIDEGLTKCNSATTQQYLETPQTTGTVWVRTNDCTALVSGVKFGTWNPYNGQDDLVWYNSGNQGGGDWQAAVNISSHQPNPNNTIIIHPYLWGCQRTNANAIGDTGLEFISPQKTILLNPKTCSVGVSNASATQGKGVKITTTGNAHINPGGDVVRSFVSKEGNPVIVNGVTYDYGGSTNIAASKDVNNYYYLDNATKTSTNSVTTSESYVIHAPPGTYRVHCDVPTDLNGNYVKCSGNPNCSFNFSGGSVDCASTGWKSCSSNDWATFTILPPPSLSDFTIRRGEFWNYMPKDSSNRSQTCDLFLADSKLPRTVVYVAGVYNPAGYQNIGTVQIRWKGDGTILNMDNIPEYNNGNNAVYSVVVSLGADKNRNAALGFEINMTNDDGDSSGWVPIRTDPNTTGTVNSNPALNVERTLKIWNCQVPVSGSLYDKTGITVGCPDWSGLLKSGPDVEFDALSFKIGGTAVPMQVTSPNYISPVGVGLTWGKSYISVFNGGLYPNPASDTLGDLLAFGIDTRIIDLGVGTSSCPSEQFNIGTYVSPYSASPRAQIDFSFVEDQEAWYQVVGAGVKSAGPFSYGVPVTVLPITSKFLTLGGPINDNGLVSATNFTNLNGNNLKDDIGSPNNWYVLRNTNDLDIYNYNYFYNNFFVKVGVGVTGKNWLGRPPKGIYFVKNSLNSLTIDNSFQLANPNTETMMVIVSGNITIDPTVTRLDGIYIADGSITAGGDNTTALTINGMLYASGDINLSRSFTDKTANNTAPAVKVNYSPGLIFNLDPRVLKVLSGWREE